MKINTCLQLVPLKVLMTESSPGSGLIITVEDPFLSVQSEPLPVYYHT
jgi:hypothetical protein